MPVALGCALLSVYSGFGELGLFIVTCHGYILCLLIYGYINIYTYMVKTYVCVCVAVMDHILFYGCLYISYIYFAAFPMLFSGLIYFCDV